MKKRRAVYPGSFDPATNGHMDIVRRSCLLFDEVIIAVIEKPLKKPFFKTRERILLLEKSLKEFRSSRAFSKNAAKIKVISFNGLLVNYMKEINSRIVVRGLRAVSDFDYEFQMALMNRKLYGLVETVFLMTDAKFSYLSSSLVKEIAAMGGDISSLVPKCVSRKIKEVIK